MNIFFFDSDPNVSASYLCDKHIVKMPTETAQIISTAYFILTGQAGFYKPTHINHPCVKWAASSYENLAWLCSYGIALGKEYTNRYGKIHSAITKLTEWLNTMDLHSLNYPHIGWADPPQCMPDIYHRQSTIDAYKAYYIGDKSRFAIWKWSQRPVWFEINS